MQHDAAWRRSVVRYYYDIYEARCCQLMNELDELRELGRTAYAEQRSRDVTTGNRSQHVLSSIKDLRRELQLCQLGTLKTEGPLALEETSLPTTTAIPKPTLPPPASRPEGFQEYPVPEWITREMQNRTPLTPWQQQRAQIQAASSVLTLAGRVLSVPSVDVVPRYFEIFNLHHSTDDQKEPPPPELAEKCEM